tara:strand:+ start:2640 stop:4688 length:2049 start_codon:yes stop_codon:yes gene_type:complete
MRIKKGFLFILIGLFVVVSFSSAEIFVGNLNDVYNIDDEIISEITLIPSVATADHFKVDMQCGNKNTNIFNQYLNLAAGQQQTVNANTRMNNLYLPSMWVNVTNSTEILNLSSNLSGNETAGNETNSSTITLVAPTYYIQLVHLLEDCNLNVNYGAESFSTGFFEISNLIEIDLDWDVDDFDPGAEIQFAGLAEKESGVLVDGFVETKIPGLGIYETGLISGGNLDYSLLIPEDAKSGKHNISIRVYQKDFTGEIINEGIYWDELKVYQFLKSLEIQVTDVNAKPGEDYTFTATTYDQANEVIDSEVSIIVFDPNDFVFMKKLIKPGTEQKIEFLLNETPGYWKIEASAGDLLERKIIYLEEIEEIQTSLINDTLVVTNIGNVFYEGPLEITIGSVVEIKNLKLKVGESQNYKLKAPDGTYSVSVSTGDESSSLGNTFLTGNAIKVVDIRSGVLDAVGSPIFWWGLIILFVLIVVLVYVKRRVLKKKDGNGMGVKDKIPHGASSSHNIGNGTKEEAYAVALKTGPDVKEVSQSIQNELMSIKKLGAKIYLDGNFKIILVTKKLTKAENNEILAVKIAKKLEDILLAHNKRFKDKIEFGIGVNNGTVISEISDGRFKFNSVGGVISGAKRIAKNHKMKAHLSETMHRKVTGAVRTEKTNEGWEIKKIRDREKHKKFLKGFSNE